jgi:hypothetical protein
MPESDPTVAGPAAPESARPRRTTDRIVQRFRFTAAEWEAIVEAAHASGKTAVAFVHDASLEAVPTGHGTVGNAPLIRALGRCGTTLAKLAATAREMGALPEAASLERTLAELLAVVRRIDEPPDTSLLR